MAPSGSARHGSTQSPVGHLVRHWRRARRLSQLALALEAATTSRHLSFIESGRSQPSREMVLRLARVLDVPIRERNQLLLAAGYAPLYREAGLAGEESAAVLQEIRLESFFPADETTTAHHWEHHPRAREMKASGKSLTGEAKSLHDLPLPRHRQALPS